MTEWKSITDRRAFWLRANDESAGYAASQAKFELLCVRDKVTRVRTARPDTQVRYDHAYFYMQMLPKWQSLRHNISWLDREQLYPSVQSVRSL